MYETLLSRFADAPTLVAAPQQKSFEGCLSALAASEHVTELMSANMAADENFWFPADDYRSSYRPYRVKDGILSIPIRGVLLAGFPWQFGNWATGYPYVWKAFERGLADPEVKAIALLCHSPGGEVAENFDLVDKMFAHRGEKPVRAFAHEYAYSAAYSIASVADQIVMSRTGGVGSIGVVTSHIDVSKMMEQMGWKITFISAPEDGHKTDGNPYEALSPETRKRMQTRIDGLYDIFVATVARNRGMDEKAIRDTKALTFSAQDAVANGLADSIGSFEDSLAAYAAEINSSDEGDEQMSDVKKEDHDRLVAEARTSGQAEGKSEGMKAGVTASKERINAILASDEGKARPKAALSAALKTDMTVGQAKAFLADLPEEKGQTNEQKTEGNANGQKFDEAMRKDNPDLGAGAGGEGADKKDESPTALAKAFGLAGFAS